MVNPRNKSQTGLKLLVLYDDWTAQTAAVREQLLAFREHSIHEICYVVATGKGASVENADAASTLAERFDVLVIHHSVRLIVDYYINPAWAAAIERFAGYKVLFTQDDYERTETTRRWIGRLGFHALFTVVPEESWEKVYPRSRFPHLERQQVLTGYVPQWAMQRARVKPLAERSRFIGYRAFELPWYLGDLAREKFMIGKRMREICEARGIAVDIEWTVDKRIYGEAWYDFTEDCRATLGTESGSNVFDDEGEIERAISEALAAEPGLSYEEIHARILSSHEGRVVMNQISPRIFEAVALGSALVLFEGEYSGVVKPHEHFIPLKKDFSNVDEVLEKLRDLPALEVMTRRARRDVVESGKYGFEAFVARFDAFLSERARPRGAERVSFWISPGDATGEGNRLTHNERQMWLTSEPFHSQSHCESFFAGRGAKLSDRETDEMQATIDNLRATAKEKSAARQRLASRERAALAIVGVLVRFLASRKVALVRALGLCGQPPKFRESRVEHYLGEIRSYVRANRWLRRFAEQDAVVREAMQARMQGSDADGES